METLAALSIILFISVKLKAAIFPDNVNLLFLSKILEAKVAFTLPFPYNLEVKWIFIILPAFQSTGSLVS